MTRITLALLLFVAVATAAEGTDVELVTADGLAIAGILALGVGVLMRRRKRAA